MRTFLLIFPSDIIYKHAPMVNPDQEPWLRDSRKSGNLLPPLNFMPEAILTPYIRKGSEPSEAFSTIHPAIANYSKNSKKNRIIAKPGSVNVAVRNDFYIFRSWHVQNINKENLFLTFELPVKVNST